MSTEVTQEVLDNWKLQNDIEQIQVKLEEVINALHSAIERGNDLHLGIVLGQSLKQLEDIVYR